MLTRSPGQPIRPARIGAATDQVTPTLGTEHASGSGATATFGAVILQIILLAAVFSLDSVITAVGTVDRLAIMIAAVMLSIGLMMVLASRIRGFDVHVDKPLSYGPIAFAIAVEALNLTYASRQKPRKAVRRPAAVKVG